MHDAWLQTFSLTATLFTFRRDTTYRLILIIAPRRRDASNRLPTLGIEGNPIAIDRESIDYDHCILLFLFHPSILDFFSRTRSILSYIFNRPSPFLDHLSRFSLAPFILGKLSYAASTLVLVNDSRNGWYDDIFTSSLQWTWIVYRIYFSLKHVCSWYWLYVDFYVTKTCSIIWLI